MAPRNKISSVYFCTGCGYESPKWLGQCPSCGEWNSFTESVRVSGKKSHADNNKLTASARPMRLSEISSDEDERMDTGLAEFTRVLGGGVVRGSVVLIGGNPGVGKSTLLLQTAACMAHASKSILYVSGEESLQQIKIRARRLSIGSDDLKFLSETDIDRVISIISDDKPDLCIIDSIQTMFTRDSDSIPGSVTQVRESAQRLLTTAKQCAVACILVGHMTKEGTVAGPRTLEHMVDAVLYFESGDQFGYRILRSAKNRFGSTNEIGVFRMDSDGLNEVKNPSEFLLEGRPGNATGAAVTCLIEGSRPLLMEVQGLIAKSQYSVARRQANGMDYNRLSMLLAVLERRSGIDLSGMDAYVNIAGGLRISEPAADLAILAAVISSYKNIIIPEDTVIIGEVGLSGEVRSIPLIRDRIREAEKLGFKRIIMPQVNIKSIGTDNITLIGVRFVSDLLGFFHE